MKSKLNFEKRKIIEQKLKEGCFLAAIAKMIGISISGLGFEISRLGRENYTAEKAQKDCNHKNKDFLRAGISLTLKKQIYDLLKQNYTGIQISRITKLSSTTVSREINRNGGRDNYNPMLSHEKFKKNEKNKGWKDRPNLTNKIANLEMQIQILTETIEELYDKVNKRL